MHKLRISPAVQMHFGGTWQAAWVAQRSGTLNIQCHAARLHQVPASTLRAGHGPRVLRFWRAPFALARTLKQLREQFHGTYLSTAEACKIQMQSTVQDAMVGETLHGISNMFCLRERFSA